MVNGRCHKTKCRWWYSLLALYLVCLPGCAFLPTLPPLLDYASWALSGVSYVLTGKGPSDHALSFMAKKDCSLFRIIRGKPICIPVTEGINHSLFSKFISRKKDMQDIRPPNLLETGISLQIISEMPAVATIETGLTF